VISGDMVNNGADDPAAYKVLREELAGRELAGRTHVIPGKHDRRAPLLEAFPEWVFWSAY
jgi:3',5'-cyclic AMP phosphodiesterase CpdA